MTARQPLCASSVGLARKFLHRYVHYCKEEIDFVVNERMKLMLLVGSGVTLAHTVALTLDMLWVVVQLLYLLGHEWPVHAVLLPCRHG